MAEKIGKYEVIDQIGRGGMGTIFRALDPILQRSVALKVISNLEVTPELRTRFFREAQACARITHPNIVIIHDMGEDKGQLFIVMELLEGEELRHVIARHADLTLKDKLDIVRQICDGLHYAHQKGVVHRDVKPANILLLRTGQVKILDFGIAQIAGAATQRDLTRTGMFLGTLRYMAPEQVRGQADRRSDIFSVAAVSYELLSGRSPFAGDDPLQILEQLRTVTPPRLTEIDPSLPSGLADVMERALQKDPADRFADLAQMGRQLDLLQRELAEGAAGVRVGAEKPIARPSSLLGPPGPAVATTPPAPEMAHEESARLWRQPGDDALRVIGPAQVRRAPRIAVGTGAALAAIVAVALYLWLPTTPRGSLADKPGPKTEATPAPPNLAAPTRDEAARPEAEKARETPRPDSRPAGEKVVSQPRASIAPSPATVTPARPSPLREPDRAESAVAPSGAREDAEQARIRMTAARQAAERVAAGFYARKRFASAQGKERDGVAALGKSDYATAVGLFAEAQAEYQAAMAETPREEDSERQLAQLRAGLDQAHAAVAARRQQALAAEADQLARDLFDQAQAKQVEGDGLASRKDLAAAARAYRDAAESYGEAAARARATRSGK
ncbi:MAG TPA: protein kinase [Candidatus Binatia bacterium]|nr:protein kinase [Candidatus Binatia bacterium]